MNFFFLGKSSSPSDINVADILTFLTFIFLPEVLLSPMDGLLNDYFTGPFSEKRIL